MNTRYSISLLIILLVILVLPLNAVNAATSKSRPAEPSRVGITAADLQKTYKCTLVKVTQIDKEANNLSFEYDHSWNFVTSKENEPAVIYTGTNPIWNVGMPYKWYPNTYSCPQDQITNIKASPSSKSWYGFADDIFAQAIQAFFGLIRTIATWTLGWLTSSLFLVILQQGTFIQSDVVKQGWPFVQGIANLGFIFALLYIALATTLRLESVSTSVQRLLPKLLIGALLVNFSLVIGGLVIDASRLLMAVELNVLTGGKNNNLNLLDQIMQTSKTYSVVGLIEKGSTDKATGSFAILLKEVTSTVVLVAIALGFGIIALNLFVRYVVLLVLLVFSPLAYLAIALPQTKKFFDEWWKMFIKWVAYGPIVLFFLILISKIQSIEVGKDAGSFASIAQFAVVVALLYIGHAASKKAAGYGSDAVMSFAQKHPRTTAAVAGTVLTGGLGGAALGVFGLGAAKRAKDFGAEVTSPIRKKFGMGEYSIYDDKGNLKKGKTSMGTRLARPVTSFSPRENKIIKDEKNKQNTAIQNGTRYTPGFDIKDLVNKEFVAKLDPDSIKAIMSSGNSQQIQALAAAIAQDKDGSHINGKQIQSIVGNANGLQPGHTDVMRSVSQNANIVQNLDGTDLQTMFSFGDKDITNNTIKSLATEVK